MDDAVRMRGNQQLSSTGWVTPLGRHGSDFIHAVNGYIMICCIRQQKLLPASVINKDLEGKIQPIEDAESRSVSRKERFAQRSRFIITYAVGLQPLTH